MNWLRKREKHLPKNEEVWSPFTAFERMFEEFGNLNRFFDEPTGFRSLSPKLDVHENENAIEVQAELPGIDPKDVDLSLEGGYLTIRGTKNETREENGQAKYRERSFGQFERTISVPDYINMDKVQATFKNGLLTILLPKNENHPSRPRKIPISD